MLLADRKYRSSEMTSMRLVPTTLCFVIVLQSPCLQPTASEVTVDVINKLSQKLLQGYNKNTLPAANFSNQFEVFIIGSLSVLGEIDEIEEKLSTVITFYTFWNDASMLWEPHEYEGIETATMSYNDVWKPSFMVCNPHKRYFHQEFDDMEDQAINFEYYGLGYMNRFMLLETACNTDTTLYPFDTQSCDICIFLTHSPNYRIKISTVWNNLDFGTGKEINESGSWRLIEKTMVGSDYSTLTITFKLQRKPMFSVINILLPVAVLALIAPLVFLMPASSGERVGYSVTILFAIALYMTIISESLPKKSDPMPLISVILFVWFILNSAIVVIVILNGRLYRIKNKRPLPDTLRRFVILTLTKRRQSRLRCCYKGESTAFTKDTKETNASKYEEEPSKLTEDIVNHLDDSINGNYRSQTVVQLTWEDVGAAVDFYVFILCNILNITLAAYYVARITLPN